MEKRKRKNDEFIEKSKRTSIEKRKNRSVIKSLLVVTFLMTGLSILGLMIIVLLSSKPTQAISPMQAEVVTVPFDEINPTYSTLAYTGVVRLVIAGTGQAGGTDYSDAFYLYAHGDGTPYIPPQLEHFDLEIDGQRAIYTLDMLGNPPAYNPDHVYTVDYLIGATPRPIAFRISDSIVDDNTGEFTISIYQLWG